MLIEKSFSFNYDGNTKYRGQIDEPAICPICKHAVKPQELYCGTYKDEKENWFLSALYLCKHCYQTFLNGGGSVGAGGVGGRGGWVLSEGGVGGRA